MNFREIGQSVSLKQSELIIPAEMLARRLSDY